MRVDTDVVCLGESMALFVPAEPGPVDAVGTWTRTVGGAESNVAIHLAALGLRSRWVSALGDDAFGRAVRDRIAAGGVDIAGVRVDPDRPTGLYVKEADAAGSPVRYYRSGSAASAMGPELLAGLDLDHTGVLHVSGITAALSTSCLELLRAVLALRRPDRLVSFDVNWRPALWQDKDPGLLRDLADRADLVFVGEDEAHAAWGVDGVDRLCALLPSPPRLVIKHAERGATLVDRRGSEPLRVFEPALRVDVVEPVGAGDAFAAGVLAAVLAGEPGRRQLRNGHLRAASALLTRDDIGPALPAELVAELLVADAERWQAARIGVGVVPR